MTGRPESIWIWGRRPVLAALRAGTAREVVVAQGRAAAEILREIHAESQRQRVPVRETSLADLTRLVGTDRSQGVAALVNQPGETDLAHLLRHSPRRWPHPFLLILDQIQDPHNLGALLRSADAAGVDGIVLPERHSAPLSPTVAKSSAGALSFVRIARAPNLARALDQIRDSGLWIAGLSGDAHQSIYDADLTVPLALIVGSEGSGLRRLTRERCDLLLHVPMLGAVESLNASVAGALAMYEAVRQRLTAKAVR
jgi:23S rRNA (guanosine2251-2'-O)-methyltransferase